MRILRHDLQSKIHLFSLSKENRKCTFMMHQFRTSLMMCNVSPGKNNAPVFLARLSSLLLTMLQQAML